MNLVNSNRRYTLIKRPTGLPCTSDFSLVTEEQNSPKDGEFVIRNKYASIDPAMRGWMDEAPSYLSPIVLGDAVRASTLGIVEESRSTKFPVGCWVTGLHALEDYTLCSDRGGSRRIDPTAVPAVTNYLSACGGIGATAYFGLMENGRPQPGDTVLVTAGAGAVGSIVGQIAKLKGCRTIGIAGGPEKCDRMMRDYQYDVAIDYRGKTEAELSGEIFDASSGGVDIIFENVGGVVLDAGLRTINPYARIVLCGLISEYNNETGSVGARNLWQLIVKGAQMNGFILTHYFDRISEAETKLTNWLLAGEILVHEHIEAGLENSLDAMHKLFSGENKGKMLIKIA